MSTQVKKGVMGGLCGIAVLLCVADVWIFLWTPKPASPSDLAQRQIRRLQAHQAGAEVARQDIGRSVLQLRSAGLPAAWSREYRQLLRTRYNIAEGSGLGCTGTEEEFASIHSYNRTMRVEIERKYGQGVLEQAAKDAESAFKDKHGMAEPKHAADGSQPFRSEADRTSGAAGSRR